MRSAKALAYWMLFVGACTHQASGEPDAFIAGDGASASVDAPTIDARREDASSADASEADASSDATIVDATDGAPDAAPVAQCPVRINISPTGEQANGYATLPELSADGSRVVFTTNATNLVPGLTGGNVLVLERSSGTYEVANVRNDGGTPDSYGVNGTISADGRRVAFESSATDIIPGDGSTKDVYVRDLLASTTSRVSVSTSGVGGNGPSEEARISGDGMHIAFESQASNLAPNNTFTSRAVYVRDLVNGTTVRASVANNGNQPEGAAEYADISDDGSIVTFTSRARNLGGPTDGTNAVYVRDLQAGTTRFIARASYPRLSANGRFIAFATLESLTPSDTNGTADVYVRDRVSNTTTRVSVGPTGASGSASGGEVTPDGRFVVFSAASSLTPDDTNIDLMDVYIRDTVANVTMLLSIECTMDYRISGAGGARISDDGRVIVFTSGDDAFVPDDTNQTADLFLVMNPLM